MLPANRETSLVFFSSAMTTSSQSDSAHSVFGFCFAGKIAEAEAGGDFEALEQLQRELTSDKKTLESELEEKKEAARNR